MRILDWLHLDGLYQNLILAPLSRLADTFTQKKSSPSLPTSSLQRPLLRSDTELLPMRKQLDNHFLTTQLPAHFKPTLNYFVTQMTKHSTPRRVSSLLLGQAVQTLTITTAISVLSAADKSRLSLEEENALLWHALIAGVSIGGWELLIRFIKMLHPEYKHDEDSPNLSATFAGSTILGIKAAGFLAPPDELVSPAGKLIPAGVVWAFALACDVGAYTEYKQTNRLRLPRLSHSNIMRAFQLIHTFLETSLPYSLSMEIIRGVSGNPLLPLPSWPFLAFAGVAGLSTSFSQLLLSTRAHYNVPPPGAPLTFPEKSYISFISAREFLVSATTISQFIYVAIYLAEATEMGLLTLSFPATLTLYLSAIILAGLYTYFISYQQTLNEINAFRNRHYEPPELGVFLDAKKNQLIPVIKKASDGRYALLLPEDSWLRTTIQALLEIRGVAADSDQASSSSTPIDIENLPLFHGSTFAEARVKPTLNAPYRLPSLPTYIPPKKGMYEKVTFEENMGDDVQRVTIEIDGEISTSTYGCLSAKPNILQDSILDTTFLNIIGDFIYGKARLDVKYIKERLINYCFPKPPSDFSSWLNAIAHVIHEYPEIAYELKESLLQRFKYEYAFINELFEKITSSGFEFSADLKDKSNHLVFQAGFFLDFIKTIENKSELHPQLTELFPLRARRQTSLVDQLKQYATEHELEKKLKQVMIFLDFGNHEQTMFSAAVNATGIPTFHFGSHSDKIAYENHCALREAFLETAEDPTKTLFNVEYETINKEGIKETKQNPPVLHFLGSFERVENTAKNEEEKHDLSDLQVIRVKNREGILFDTISFNSSVMPNNTQARWRLLRTLIRSGLEADVISFGFHHPFDTSNARIGKFEHGKYNLLAPGNPDGNINDAMLREIKLILSFLPPFIRKKILGFDFAHDHYLQATYTESILVTDFFIEYLCKEEERPLFQNIWNILKKDKHLLFKEFQEKYGIDLSEVNGFDPNNLDRSIYSSLFIHFCSIKLTENKNNLNLFLSSLRKNPALFAQFCSQLVQEDKHLVPRDKVPEKSQAFLLGLQNNDLPTLLEAFSESLLFEAKVRPFTLNTRTICGGAERSKKPKTPTHRLDLLSSGKKASGVGITVIETKEHFRQTIVPMNFDPETELSSTHHAHFVRTEDGILRDSLATQGIDQTPLEKSGMDDLLAHLRLILETESFELIPLLLIEYMQRALNEKTEDFDKKADPDELESSQYQIHTEAQPTEENHLLSSASTSNSRPEFSFQDYPSKKTLKKRKEASIKKAKERDGKIPSAIWDYFPLSQHTKKQWGQLDEMLLLKRRWEDFIDSHYDPRANPGVPHVTHMKGSMYAILSTFSYALTIWINILSIMQNAEDKHTLPHQTKLAILAQLDALHPTKAILIDQSKNLASQLREIKPQILKESLNAICDHYENSPEVSGLVTFTRELLFTLNTHPVLILSYFKQAAEETEKAEFKAWYKILHDSLTLQMACDQRIKLQSSHDQNQTEKEEDLDQRQPLVNLFFTEEEYSKKPDIEVCSNWLRDYLDTYTKKIPDITFFSNAYKWGRVNNIVNAL